MADLHSMENIRSSLLLRTACSLTSTAQLRPPQGHRSRCAAQRTLSTSLAPPCQPAPLSPCFKTTSEVPKCPGQVEVSEAGVTDSRPSLGHGMDPWRRYEGWFCHLPGWISPGCLWGCSSGHSSVSPRDSWLLQVR
jgi:hypothetical protein